MTAFDYIPSNTRVKFLLPHAKKHYKKIQADLKELGVEHTPRNRS